MPLIGGHYDIVDQDAGHTRQTRRDELCIVPAAHLRDHPSATVVCAHGNCVRLEVGRFVHHSPEDAPVEAGEELLTSQEYVAFLRRYRLLFGEPAPVDLWPRCRGWHIVNGSFEA